MISSCAFLCLLRNYISSFQSSLYLVAVLQLKPGKLMRFMESHVMVVSISFLLLFVAHRCAKNELGHMGAFSVPTPKDCVARCVQSQNTDNYICCGKEFGYKPMCEKICQMNKTCCKENKTCCKIQS
ncbi:hypothetical protein HanIR_Chr17g0896421 [Helianthus annuus]|nr:hypothetical protein HanIR_Chr17g0896421 [Helianthus annuus]